MPRLTSLPVQAFLLWQLFLPALWLSLSVDGRTGWSCSLEVSVASC